MSWVAWLWGAALLLPYPAFPIGSNAGLQVGHVLIIALSPFALLGYRLIPRAWLGAAALLVPQVIGLFATGLRQVDFNATVFYMLALLALPVTAYIFRLQPRAFLTGVCTALALHGLVGLYQSFAFTRNEFPLQWLFVNPSFAEFTDEWAQIYAEYVKRPFGLTPEPSALLSFAAPWVLLLGWTSFDPSRWNGRPYFELTLARVLGLAALIITFVLSTSGGLIFFGAGAVALVLIHAVRKGEEGAIRTALIIIAVVAALWAAQLLVVDRYESEFEQLGSWDERAISMMLGLRFIGQAGLIELWFGYGAGTVSTMADRAQSTAAIHSMVLTYVVANGLVGAIGLLVFAAVLLRSAWRSGDALVWSILLGVWLSGPLFVTSYEQLLGLWGFLALPLVVSPAPPRRVV